MQVYCFNAPCPIVTHTVELPLLEVRKDRCNIPHYIAQRDLRGEEGNFEELEVLDNTKSECAYASDHIFMPPPPTEVFYTTKGMTKESNTLSRFEGTAFQRIRPEPAAF
jgi:hypothetical protein